MPEPPADDDRPIVSIVCQTADFTAAKIVDPTSELIEFEEKTMTASFTSGDIMYCHGRNLMFVALVHPKDNEVTMKENFRKKNRANTLKFVLLFM